MSNSFLQNAVYLLLFLVEFTLSILNRVVRWVVFNVCSLLKRIFNINMTEKSKKRKRNSNTETNQTVASRGIIDANWQKLLSSNLMEKKIEKSSQEKSKEHFNGTFRRARKKQAKDVSNLLQNNLKGLDLQKETTDLDEDSKILEKSDTKVDTKANRVVNNKVNNTNKLTKFVAMDCEMVGIGYDGADHMLARVSLVNKFGDCIYDKFVKPREEVIDYRTDVSGVRKEDLLNGEEFSKVQKEVAEIIRGRVLVGHSLKNDLSVLFLSHPKRNIRDTARYKAFRKITKGNTPSLKRLAKEILSIDIQHGEHSSVEDARAAMQLYCTVAKKWESTMSEKRGYNKKLLDE